MGLPSRSSGTPNTEPKPPRFWAV